MVDKKWAELVTVKSVLSVKGDNMLAKFADKSYAKVSKHDPIDLKDALALRIL